ncbi:MAG: D-sedoheptulose 7-phosphate isomerase [Paludibacteraceae bacterium]|nr:D-sedoheptulose 7-phosphate isomerase [Paludibacteraceae bacterium]
MKNEIETIKQAERLFRDGIELRERFINDRQNLEQLCLIADRIYMALKNGNKILLCGNGGSAADAQHIAAELVGRFEIADRKGLPAIALTTDTSILTAVGNDYGYDYVFQRQVEALGLPGDVLIALSTSGKSLNIARALDAANKQGLVSVALLGGTGGICKDKSSISIVVPSISSARIQEMHITIGHILCAIVEQNF